MLFGTPCSTMRTGKLWNWKMAFRIKSKKSYEQQTQQLCTVNRPISINLWFKKCLHGKTICFVTASNTHTYNVVFLIHCFLVITVLYQVDLQAQIKHPGECPGARIWGIFSSSSSILHQHYSSNILVVIHFSSDIHPHYSSKILVVIHFSSDIHPHYSSKILVLIHFSLDIQLISNLEETHHF